MNNNENKFDKEAWVKKKQKEREDVYDIIDDMVEKVKNDPIEFKKYLDVQTQFDKYSTNNALLIAAQMPEARQLKEYNDWQKLRVYVDKNPKWVTILKAGKSYTRDDGTTGVYYTPTKMLDISQTNANQKIKQPIISDKILIKALLENSPINVKVIDNPNNNAVEWNKDENTIYISKNIDSTTMFNSVTKELAKASMEDNDNPAIAELKSKAISYMVCKKNNNDVSNYDFNNTKDVFMFSSEETVKNVLNSINNGMKDINYRINTYINTINKDNRNKDEAR